jgi:hypothetical protein
LTSDSETGNPSISINTPVTIIAAPSTFAEMNLLGWPGTKDLLLTLEID